MSLITSNSAYLDSNNNYVNLGSNGNAYIMISPSDSFLTQYQIYNNNPYNLFFLDQRSNNVQFAFSSNSATLYINSNLCITSNLSIPSMNTMQIKKNLYSYSLYTNTSNIFNFSLSNYNPFIEGYILFSGCNIIDNFQYQPIIVYNDPVNFTNQVSVSNLVCNNFSSPEITGMSNIIFGNSNPPYSFCNINAYNIISSNDIPLSINPCIAQNYILSYDTLTNITQLSSNSPVKINQPLGGGWGWQYSNQYVDLGPLNWTPGNSFTLMSKFQWSPSNNSSNQTIFKTTTSTLSNNQDSIWLYCFQNTQGQAIQADCYNSNILGSRLTSYGWSNNTPYSVALRYSSNNSNYSLFVNGCNVASNTGIFTLSNKQFTNNYCGLDYFQGNIFGVNLYPYAIPDSSLITYQGMTQYSSSPYRIPEGFRNLAVDFTPQSTNFRTSISNYNVTYLASNLYCQQTFSNFGNVNIGSNLIVNSTFSNLGNANIVGNVVNNSTLSNQGNVSLNSNVNIGGVLSNQGNVNIVGNQVNNSTLSNVGNVSCGSNVNIGGVLSNQGNVNFVGNQINNQTLSNAGNVSCGSNVIIANILSNLGNAYFTSNVIISQSCSNLGSQVIYGNTVIGGSLSNIGSVSFTGGTLYVKGDISNVGFSAVSNNSLYGSNTAYFSSNLSIITSNIASWSSNTAYFSSNLSIINSNTSIFSCNIAVYASNNFSNVATSSSVTTANATSIYGSNTSYYASNLAVYDSNQIYSLNANTQYSLQIGFSNTSTLSNNLTFFTTSNLTTSNLSLGPIIGNLSGKQIIANISTPGQNIGTNGSAGGVNTYAGSLSLKAGDVTGNYWGGNPSNFGADLYLQAGNINQGQGNNGTAFVSGFAGSVRIMPGFSFVNTAGAANQRYVESGRIFFYNTNTNGASIDTSCNICGTFDNYGRFGLNTSNPGYQLDVRGDTLLASNVFLSGGSNLQSLLSTLSNYTLNSFVNTNNLSNNLYGVTSSLSSSIINNSNYNTATYATISNVNTLSNFSISLSNYAYQNSNSTGNNQSALTSNINSLSNYTYLSINSNNSNLISLSNYTINLNNVVYSGFANTNGNLVSLSNYTLSNFTVVNSNVNTLSNYTISNFISTNSNIFLLSSNVSNNFSISNLSNYNLSNIKGAYFGSNVVISNSLAINTGSSSYNFDLLGSGRISAGQSKFVINSTQGGGGTQAGIDMFTYQQSSIPGASIYAVDDAGYGGHLVFLNKSPGNSNNPNVEKARLSSSGNFGIGTNLPNYLLDVNGQAHIASNLLIGNSTDTSRAISILNNNLGSNSAYYITLGQSNSTNNQAELTYQHIAAGNSSNNFSIGFFGNTIRPLTLLANNYIGINNQNPNFGLHQNCSNGSGGAMCLSSPYANEASFKWSNLNNAWIGGIGSYGTGSNFGLGSATYGGLFFLTHSGNTGIGVANNNPQYTLDVSGTIRSTSSNLISGAFPLCLGFDVSNKETNAGKISYQQFSGNCLDVVGAGSNAGNRKIYMYDQLGVSTNPNYTLDVGGTGHINGQLLLRDGTSNDTSRFISALNNSISSFNFSGFTLGQSASTNNAAELTYYHSANGSSSNTVSLGFYQNNRILTVNAGGFCGINNNNPVYNLDVSGTSRITGSLVQNTILQWRYNFNTNSAASPSGGGNIAWSYSNFAYSAVGSISVGNTLLTQSATPTNYGLSAPIIQFPYSGIYSLNLQCRFNTSSSENALWFAPFSSSTYNESSSNANGARLGYISNSSYNTPIHYTGYFAANDTLALLAFSATAGIYLQNGFYNGLTVQLIQRTS